MGSLTVQQFLAVYSSKHGKEHHNSLIGIVNTKTGYTMIYYMEYEYDSDSTSDSIEIHMGKSLLKLLGIITEMKAECIIGIPMTPGNWLRRNANDTPSSIHDLDPFGD